MYRYQVLIEGNDPRFIDVGLLSKKPIGAITSWQKSVHEDYPDYWVFGRDFLEVEILDDNREEVLFKIFNNHLKSKFIPFWVDDKEEVQRQNDARRRRQAEVIRDIVTKVTSEDDRYLILGDMNDTPDSQCLQPFIRNLNLLDGLETPTEKRTIEPKASGYTPDLPEDNARWTHRYKPSGEDPEYKLFDQIWLSPSLEECFDEKNAWIDRRVRYVGGDGSDHDAAYIQLNL